MILIDGEENAGSAISLTQAGAIPTPRPGNHDNRAAGNHANRAAGSV